MTTFAQVRDSRVLSHFTKNCTLAEARAMFPDIAEELHEAPDNVQDGWELTEDYCGPVRVGPVEIEAEIVAEAQRRLDAFALARGYDDIKSLVTYVDDPDPVFAQEGAIGRAKRSALWAALRDYKELVLAGQAPLPQSIDDIPNLPALTWE